MGTAHTSGRDPLLDKKPDNLINGSQQFSVYNIYLDEVARTNHPLGDLLPNDNEHEWHVARNLLKPLNHLDFLKRKEEIAITLNLHNVLTPRNVFEPNYAILAKHQARQISTPLVIKHLTEQLQQGGKKVSHIDIQKLLQEYATVRHMEFHPSDVCNLTCRGCTYGHDVPELKPLPINFPSNAIKKIAQLEPRSMVIIGGGEPTLYKSGEYRFQEMVEEIRDTNPGIHLALVTNGTHKPKGNWPQWFSWIRISLDAATQITYTDFRGKPMFDRVVQNYLSYLDYDIPYVGISYLFAKSNIHEYAAVARFIFELVKKEKPHALRKVNIQYRPLRRDPYQYNGPFAEAISFAQIEQAVKEVRELADSSPEMKQFLREQTNVTAVLGGNTHPPYEFARCYYSETFKIVRANGDLRPCFIRVMEPDFILGNVVTDSSETIALNTLYIATRRKPYCDAHGCRQCHVNYTFEQGLKGKLKQSSSPEVLADPMF